MREACDNPVEIELKHPATDEPLGIFVSIVGAESTAMREHERKAANADIRKARKGKAAGTSEDVSARIIEMALIALVGWREMESHGKALDYSEEVADELLRKPGYDWIAIQVFQGAKDLTLFTQA